MSNPDITNDITRWRTVEEGQFFERKSAIDRSGGRPKQRKAADIARDVAETLSAMANADGGELVVGIEDDGTVTGDQKRVLAYAHAHGDRFTSREYQKVIGTDIYGASTAIKDMIRKGIADLPVKRGKVYTVREPLHATAEMPLGLVKLLPFLQRSGRLSNKDARRIFALNRIAIGRILRELVATEWLMSTGKKGVGAFYRPGPRLLNQSPIVSQTRESDSMGPETDSMKRT